MVALSVKHSIGQAWPGMRSSNYSACHNPRGESERLFPVWAIALCWAQRLRDLDHEAPGSERWQRFRRRLMLSSSQLESTERSFSFIVRGTPDASCSPAAGSSRAVSAAVMPSSSRDASCSREFGSPAKPQQSGRVRSLDSDAGMIQPSSIVLAVTMFLPGSP